MTRTHRTRDVVSERRDERGSILVEAVMCLALAGIMLAGFVGVVATSGYSQRHARATDVAAQAARGLSEKMDALAWDKVATWTGDYPSTTYGGRPVVAVTGSTRPAGVLATTQPADTINGVRIQMSVYVTWVAPCAPTACASSNPVNGFGTKRITVVTTYSTADVPERTSTFTYDRYPRPDEAAPVNLPAA